MLSSIRAQFRSPLPRIVRRHCSAGTALVLRRGAPAQAFPFSLSKVEAFKEFDDWAERHGAAADLSATLAGQGWKRQEGVEACRMYVPFWSFESEARLGGFGGPMLPKALHNVYCGDQWDAISLTDACATEESRLLEALGELIGFDQCYERYPDAVREAVSVPASVAWQAAIADGAPAERLGAVLRI